MVSNTCDLNYEGESGALNESVADVFGILSKQYHLKVSRLHTLSPFLCLSLLQITIGQSDWIIGAGTVPNGPGLRTFKAGQANDDDIQPKTVEEWHKKLEDPNFKRYLSYDSGGVHVSPLFSLSLLYYSYFDNADIVRNSQSRVLLIQCVLGS